MSNPFKTPQFKKLAKAWNKKLVAKGHKEIEDFNLPEPPLLRNEVSYFRNIDLDDYKYKLNYYKRARELLNTFIFKNEIHKQIWTMHSEGVPAREIARRINRWKVKKSTVHNVIKLIRKEITHGQG